MITKLSSCLPRGIPGVPSPVFMVMRHQCGGHFLRNIQTPVLSKSILAIQRYLNTYLKW